MMADPDRALHSRLADLYRELSDAHGKLARTGGEDYVDQHHSPLGRRLRCRLVRSGAMEGYRAGRRILTKRSAIDEYLAQHRIAPTEPAVGTEDEDDALLAGIGGGRAG
jgi:excisionase family DNA binding protein